MKITLDDSPYFKSVRISLNHTNKFTCMENKYRNKW